MNSKDKELLACAKPCPFCGSEELGFTFRTEYGHGDSGFLDLSITCECGARRGNGYGYGSPSHSDKAKVLGVWNKRVEDKEEFN